MARTHTGNTIVFTSIISRVGKLISSFATRTDRFELSDGYYKEEKGVAVHPGVENSPVDVTGFYRYINDDGTPIEVHYTANQNGFVPEGEHIQPEITSNARSLVEAKARGLVV